MHGGGEAERVLSLAVALADEAIATDRWPDVAVDQIGWPERPTTLQVDSRYASTIRSPT
jgi:hypothetical protein